MTREQLARLVALGALAIAVVALMVTLLGGGSQYLIHAQFSDAGQLVRGDLVTIAGHQVGSVGAIKLSDNGLADVELNIHDSSITPIRRDTRATIGQLSLTGIANRFVGLSPGTGPPIPSGGTLPVTQTRGIVDLDILLDALTPRVRSQLQQILRTGAYFLHKPTAPQLNGLAHYLNPAFSQSTRLGSEIVADKFALERLVSSSASLSSALAARSADLGGAVTSTAATLRQLAAQRSALQDALVRAPAVLRQGGGVLADVRYSLGVLNPLLVDLQPVAPRVGTLLRELIPTGGTLAATIAGIKGLVPGAKAALLALPPVEKKATPAVKSLTSALNDVTPILAGLRPYTPDVVAGFFNGVGGATGGTYDANGHYLKSELTVQGGGGSLTGLTSLLGSSVAQLVGPFNGGRVQQIAPCPGGGNPPAADRSNPWTSPDLLPKTSPPPLCDPSHDQRP